MSITNKGVPFADLSLARRLERAEGQACREFAEARSRLYPESGAAWIECAGAYAVFDGIQSPVTQTFGLGLFEALDRIERFFLERGAPVVHEVSPLAGVATLNLLCARNYRPIELSSVLYLPLEEDSLQPIADLTQSQGSVTVRITGSEESALWADISARGWAHDFPEMLDALLQFGGLAADREHCVSFLAELDGEPGGAGALCLHEGVALFGGASTVPEMRQRGLQSALLKARMRYAVEHGYTLAMMVTEAGSQSQRNAERLGFRIAYTRTKWQLS
jgi:GNAT superfamily N-acetyltransferase